MPILHRVYELYKLFYQYSQHFPQKDRYVFGQRCEKLILDILELILSATQSDNKLKKVEFLEEISVKLNILRIFIRLGKETKIIDFKKYLTIQERINEIGKMLGGWIKYLK